MMKTLSIYTFVFLMGVAIAQAVFYYPAMPETMATNFGSGGEVNSWMSRNTFFILEAVIYLTIIFSFLVMPWFFENKKIKTRIKLPNKDYWLAPNRIDEFYKYFRTSFTWFGVVTMVLLVGVVQLVFEANFLPTPVLNEKIFLMLLVGYLAFAIMWTISFYRKCSNIG